MIGAGTGVFEKPTRFQHLPLSGFTFKSFVTGGISTGHEPTEFFLGSGQHACACRTGPASPGVSP